jgi:hypothetical protein
MHLYRFLFPFAALTVALTATAQSPANTGSTLSGHVICADTNLPARFAKVMLKSTSATAPGDGLFGDLAALSKTAGKNSKLSAEDQAQQAEQLAAATKMLAAMSDLLYSATVGIDGTYTFTNVKPGTYYIHATEAGYVDPFAAIPPDDLTSTDPATRKRVAAEATMVTVDGTALVRADLRLDRGASITGRVLYDDGTPAAGWTVRPVRPTAAGPNPFAAMGIDASDVDFAHIAEMAVTDDTGRFHIAGLSSGTYTLQARLSTSPLSTNANNRIGGGSGIGAVSSGAGGGNMFGDLMGLRLTVYSGNTLRLADARPLTLRAGEDRTGEEIVMPLRALHSIAGHVVAKSSGRPVNSGTVELTAQDAAGKDDPSIHLTASIRPDGSFRFDYVASPLVFTLRAAHAREMPPPAPPRAPAADGKPTSEDQALFALAPPPPKPLHVYGPASVTAQLADGDLDNQVITVPDAPSAP